MVLFLLGRIFISHVRHQAIIKGHFWRCLLLLVLHLHDRVLAAGRCLLRGALRHGGLVVGSSFPSFGHFVLKFRLSSLFDQRELGKTLELDTPDGIDGFQDLAIPLGRCHTQGGLPLVIGGWSRSGHRVVDLWTPVHMLGHT